MPTSISLDFLLSLLYIVGPSSYLCSLIFNFVQKEDFYIIKESTEIEPKNLSRWLMTDSFINL